MEVQGFFYFFSIMLYLLLAIFFTTLMLVVFKLIGLYKVNVEQAVAFNYLFASVTGFILTPTGSSVFSILEKDWFVFAVLAGTMFMLNFYVFAASSKKDGVAITAVSSKMSVVIPVLAGFLLFKDEVTLIKIAGILLGLFSFLLILYPSEKISVPRHYLLFPVLLFLGTGLNDTIVKYVQFNFLNGDESLFVESVFTVSFVLSWLVLIFKMIKVKKGLDVKSVVAGLILGAVNFMGAWNFLKSMAYFQASVLFPVVNVSVVTLSTLTGMIIFKEKLKPINLLGLFMALMAILMISLG